MKTTHILYMVMAAMIGVACSDRIGGDDAADASDGYGYVKVGGVDCRDQIATEVVTRATYPAEKVDWLKPSLEKGIDLTYYLQSNSAEKRTATLKLGDNTENQTDSTLYTLLYNDPTNTDTYGKQAQWLGNGGHVFHGFHIPQTLKDTEVSGEVDMRNDDKYYENLVHYLCLPPDYQINATLAYVRIPFRHRLARVLAFVLVDPILETDIKDNVITMENVQVLKNVEGETPRWVKAQRVLPHVMGLEYGSINKDLEPIAGVTDFIAYYDKKTEGYIYPVDEAEWKKARTEYANSTNKDNCKYAEINYGKVPCYDIIVRPTYTRPELVMYDEAAGISYGEENSIDFRVKLANGLEYNKTFKFVLNSNYQTIVFLRITREKVDFEETGSELWNEQIGYDGPYGLDNDNEHRLSKAGGSWQRAYRIGTDNDPVTDGNKYERQYISEEEWVAKLKKAVVEGDNWGDYFVLERGQNVTIDVDDLPADWDFAGHLDARGGSITLTGGVEGERYLMHGLNGKYDAPVGTANIHEEKGVKIPLEGFRAEVLNLTVMGGKLFSPDAVVTGYTYNNKEE